MRILLRKDQVVSDDDLREWEQLELLIRQIKAGVTKGKTIAETTAMREKAQARQKGLAQRLADYVVVEVRDLGNL